MLNQVLADLLHVYKQGKQNRKALGSSHNVEASAPNVSSGHLEHGWFVFGDQSELVRPFDVAVVMPTVGRPTAADAVTSVFVQAGVPRIQLLIGVDAPLDPFSDLIALLESAPPNVTTCLFYPGYSTSVRHGGLHPARDGGALRTILTYLANSRYVAYLDDVNWWAPTHLRRLADAIAGKNWAFSHRWFVHPETRQVACEDRWESVGPGKGIFLKTFGGWVDPNCLLLDKLCCEPAIRRWSVPLAEDEETMSADRHVYDYLQRNGTPGEVLEPTVYCAMQAEDALHSLRVGIMGDLYDKAGGGRVPA